MTTIWVYSIYQEPMNPHIQEIHLDGVDYTVKIALFAELIRSNKDFDIGKQRIWGEAV